MRLCRQCPDTFDFVPVAASDRFSLMATLQMYPKQRAGIEKVQEDLQAVMRSFHQSTQYPMSASVEKKQQQKNKTKQTITTVIKGVCARCGG